MNKTVMLLVSVVMITTVEAKKKDPVVMTVAGKDVPLSEFIYIAKKDNSVDLTNKKSVDNFVELFKNYKLKVADAEALNIHKSPKFEREHKDYANQLQASFLSDKAGEDSALHVVYERTKYIPGCRHIYFRFPSGEIVSKDTVDAYNRAVAAYNRIKNGESFESVGKSLVGSGDQDTVTYVDAEYVYPLQIPRTVENKLFSMKEGEICEPLRSEGGFHLMELYRKTPNPGRVRVAHILIAFPADKPAEEQDAAALQKADSIYELVVAGEDFAELARQFSADTVTGKRGGVLPYFGLGMMVEPFEKTGFAFENVGDISKPVQTRYGYHLLKLLDRKKEISFEEMEAQLYESMRQSDRNFDLYRSFDEKMKKRFGYVFYPEAYDELRQLADLYFPTDTSFYYAGMKYTKPLITLKEIDFPQYEFVDYLMRQPISAKPFSLDFMQEI
ncbi:MAG: peptidylprolyl isomerase, partial [Tannerella sp.]|nr:peptidylprolyl isomerase [Tannerella sp.]